MLRATDLRVRQFGLAVARKVDRDLVAQRGEGAGQGTDYISETAGLGIGHTFRGRKSDMHEADPPWRSRGRRAQDMMKKTSLREPMPAQLVNGISVVSLNGPTKEGQTCQGR